MVNNTTDPKVMETLKEVKRTNEQRKDDVSRLESLNEFQREIGQPNLESEKFVQQSKININKVNSALKKRGV